MKLKNSRIKLNYAAENHVTIPGDHLDHFATARQEGKKIKTNLKYLNYCTYRVQFHLLLDIKHPRLILLKKHH